MQIWQPMCNAGKPPKMRCPYCETFVHESAFHEQDKLTAFFVGETVLSWEKAYKALDNVWLATVLLSHSMSARACDDH